VGAPVQVGDMLADKYEVTRILGTGGMGIVVAARHCELDMLVALKFMHVEMSSNEQVTERFLREARAAARLRNEHVAHVLDVGRLPNRVPYIVMEYLEGQDLGRHLDERGPLEVADAVEYVMQVCEAMAEAHVHGIIHRDLKPQNLFLTTRSDGRRLVKVLDFGISKAQSLQGPTSTSQAIGSPSYMAPEQIRSSRSVDARADIWSLGVILYQLISNTLPFEGDTVPEVIFNVLSQPTPSLGSVRSGVPADLVRAVERCLEKERDRRFANVAELAHELLPFTPERARAAISLVERVMMAGVQQPRSSTSDPELAAVVPSGDTPSEASPKPMLRGPMQTTLSAATSSISVGERSNPSRWRWILVAATGVAATAIIAVIAMRPTAPSAPAASPGTAVNPSTDADVVAGDSFIDTPIHAALNAPIDTPPDAPMDAPADAPMDAPADAKSHVAPRAVPRKIVIDAGAPITSDAPFLEPARPDDEPLPPAR
jgi:eukaryotic-like serine/threonine-protein kinase